MSAKRAKPETKENRGATRRPLRLKVSTYSTGSAKSAVIRDLSETGLLIESEAELALNQRIEIELPRTGDHVAKVVWRSGRLFGCQLERPISRAVVSAAQLQSPTDITVPVSGLRVVRSRVSGAFHERLLKLRQMRGLSRGRVAKLAGVSIATLRNWEHGRTRPRTQSVQGLANVLGVEAEWLLEPPEEQADCPTSSVDREQGNKSGARFRPTDPQLRLIDLIAASKHQIASVAGTTPERVKIQLEF